MQIIIKPVAVEAPWKHMNTNNEENRDKNHIQQVKQIRNYFRVEASSYSLYEKKNQEKKGWDVECIEIN